MRIQYQNARFFKEYVRCLCMILSKNLQSRRLICCFDENKDVTSVKSYKLYIISKNCTMMSKFCGLLKSLLKLYNNFS